MTNLSKWVVLAALVALCFALLSCERECVQGQMQECTCPNLVKSEQVCQSGGAWGACRCKGDTGSDSVADSDTNFASDSGTDGSGDTDTSTDTSTVTDANTDTDTDTDTDTVTD
ncbi:MAG: hypothetical protein MUC50_23145 [Myxococcota bacterium]|nr:hypothetical protein [Myxococcota bacterium]